jgi:HPt (histidine-containing phosphotransfer) domain-containing protein
VKTFATFDRDNFMALIEGDQELFDSLLTLFEADWQQLVDKIRQSCVDQDARTLEAMAHRLKGNVRNFYAQQAADLAEVLEQAGKKSEFEGKLEVLDQLVLEIHNLLKDLRTFQTEIR